MRCGRAGGGGRARLDAVRGAGVGQVGCGRLVTLMPVRRHVDRARALAEPYPQVFRIDVDATYGSWTVFRRYSEFRSLHQRIKLWAARLGVRFPGRSAARERVTDTQYYTFLQTRREALDAYVQAIAAVGRTPQDLALLDFFGIGDHVPVRPWAWARRARRT